MAMRLTLTSATFKSSLRNAAPGRINYNVVEREVQLSVAALQACAPGFAAELRRAAANAIAQGAGLRCPLLRRAVSDLWATFRQQTATDALQAQRELLVDHAIAPPEPAAVIRHQRLAAVPRRVVLVVPEVPFAVLAANDVQEAVNAPEDPVQALNLPEELMQFAAEQQNLAEPGPDYHEAYPAEALRNDAAAVNGVGIAGVGVGVGAGVGAVPVNGDVGDGVRGHGQIAVHQLHATLLRMRATHTREWDAVIAAIDVLRAAHE